jgi:hypothetical protein
MTETCALRELTGLAASLDMHESARSYQTVIFINEFSLLPPEMNLVQKIWEVQTARSHSFGFLVPLAQYDPRLHRDPRIVLHTVYNSLTQKPIHVVLDCDDCFLVVTVRRGRNGSVLTICALATIAQKLGEPSRSLNNTWIIEIESLLAQSAWCHKRGSGSQLLNILIAWLSGITSPSDDAFLFLIDLPRLPKSQIKLRVNSMRAAIPFYLRRGFAFDSLVTSVQSYGLIGVPMSRYIQRLTSGSMSSMSKKTV